MDRTSTKRIGFDLNFLGNQHLLRHRRFLEGGGYIKQIESGVFSFSPLCVEVLNRLVFFAKNIFSEAGIEEVILPIVQRRSLWEKSGRLKNFSQTIGEVSNKLIISPSHEELVCYMLPKRIFQDQMPQMYMSFGHCYREELRSKNGLLRCREFLLLDGYAVCANFDQQQDVYYRIKDAISEFLSILNLNFQTVYFQTQNGTELSEEFVVTDCEVGEKRLLDCSCGKKYRYPQFKKCPCGCDVLIKRAIEFADIVRGDTLMASKFDAGVVDRDNNVAPYFLLSFGIGISKLLGLMVEASDDFIWPDLITPYHIAVVGQRKDVVESDRLCKFLLQKKYLRVLLDDRDLTIGRRVKEMQALGFPKIIVVGGKKAPLEFIDRRKKTVSYYAKMQNLLKDLS